MNGMWYNSQCNLLSLDIQSSVGKHSCPSVSYFDSRRSSGAKRSQVIGARTLDLPARLKFGKYCRARFGATNPDNIFIPSSIRSSSLFEWYTRPSTSPWLTSQQVTYPARFISFTRIRWHKHTNIVLKRTEYPLIIRLQDIRVSQRMDTAEIHLTKAQISIGSNRVVPTYVRIPWYMWKMHCLFLALPVFSLGNASHNVSTGNLKTYAY